MKDFTEVCVGDELRIVGMGAPGFANLGDVVKVTKIIPYGVEVELLTNGHRAEFILSCGASRLEKME